MKVLVLNCGSSSIKFQLFDMETATVLTKGIVEKIGLKSSFMKLELNGDKKKIDVEVPEHTKGIEDILNILVSKEDGALSSLEEIDAVGHRVAHGGEKFSHSAFVTDEVIKEIEGVSDLAPLHNPNNLKGIYAIQKLLPKTPQVAVFDTAFHQTMPDYAYMYGLPYEMYTKYGVRRYGFHGTSHRYVAEKACEKLNHDMKDKKIITCHLGNGASIAAIDKGKSIDTSMGLTPVEGLIMGTRTGDLDLGAFIFVMEKEDLTLNTAKSMINKRSGMYGITGVSPDMREIREEADKGNQRALLALNMYNYRVKKYIGSYAAAMNGVDMIVFTGGIGENDWETRRDVLKGLGYLGLEFDESKNEKKKGEDLILSKDNSNVVAMVIPTNEELVIARDTQEIVNNK
ncbi:MAG: acetate/propionate family kinase [Bacteroidales bacterium]